MVLITTGSDTIAMALSGALSYLTANLKALTILMDEVRSKFNGEHEMTLEALFDVPYLNAVLNEAIRLCPLVPIMLPRFVPAGGDTVCGMWMPGGVSFYRKPI